MSEDGKIYQTFLSEDYKYKTFISDNDKKIMIPAGYT